MGIIEELIKSKKITHWAEEIVLGDRCKATIRHETDGSKNIHNVSVIVIENISNEKKIKASFLKKVAFIEYNDLQK